MAIKRSPLPPPSYAGTKVGINNELIPNLKVFAKVIEEWKEDAIGDVFQVECEATNRDRDILPVFFVEMSPPDCVQSIWNLEEVDKGVYQLLGYWTEAGGLESGDTMRWGMLVTTCTPTITLKPHHEVKNTADEQEKDIPRSPVKAA